MRMVEKEGKTFEHAIELALKELGTTRDEVKIEYLQEPKTSFLGLGGSRLAKVRVYYLDEYGKKTLQILNNIFTYMNINVDVEIEKETESEVYVKLSTFDSGLLIGKRGKTLDAIQFLLNAILNKGRVNPIKAILDISDYRQKRIETLRKLALSIAQRVKKTRQPVTLGPMNPFERRIIHMTLQDDPEITSFSIGKSSIKKIKIAPKNYTE